jgi:ubiquitin C-terminal hydrolase
MNNKSGLNNRGNTCYLNTSIQCLYNLPGLTEYFVTNNYVNDININIRKKKLISDDILFTKEYAKLIIKMSIINKFSFFIK